MTFKAEQREIQELDGPAAVSSEPLSSEPNASSPRRNNLLPDIKPNTPISTLDREKFGQDAIAFPIDQVAPVLGMSASFIRKVCGAQSQLTKPDVLKLLDLDAFSETFVPRSKILGYLEGLSNRAPLGHRLPDNQLVGGDALSVLRTLPDNSVQCVVTSTPYWGLRLYDDPKSRSWADGEQAVFGHEQTPEAFIRHSVELLVELKRVITNDGSIWWNLMDTFNTRTQIRGNAAQALKAMQGHDRRKWTEHDCRRYSAGHAYLKDGEQCMIPSRVAEQASRAGLFVKTMVTWAKTSSLPEPQQTRVSRNLEYVIHMSKTRSPYIDKGAYLALPAKLGGRNDGNESAKLSDVWILPTSAGRDGHGAQFPLSLPARCIAISSRPGDLVIDPFVGSGNAGVAAKQLSRRFLGIDVVEAYLDVARGRIAAAEPYDNNSSIK